jgi:uncharacterized protein YndB with AHSA1/START domain
MSSSGNVSVTRNEAERELILERVFNAPRDLVFQAFGACEHLRHWWGPRGWTLPMCEMDFRAGGVWNYCMGGPGGERSCGKAVFQEITPPARIVYTDSFADENGNPLPNMPEMQVAVEFTESDGQTRLTTRSQFASLAELDAVVGMGMLEGISETWDRLEEYLTSQH